MQTYNQLKHLVLFLAVFSGHTSIQGQRILVEKGVKAGELLVFPELENPNNYYYLPDKPRIAKQADGRPAFLFLRYVKNEKTASDVNKSITNSNSGGGIVHALIELYVSPDQLEAAGRELRKINGAGIIKGPLIYKSGTVSLISAVASPGGEKVERVIGVGSAPILENQKSAIAVQLDPEGAQLLWETFNSSTPDFSIKFEMEYSGYLSPKQVLIEANFERIYKHRIFDGAISGNLGSILLGAEIRSAYDELYKSGAVRITQIGSDSDLEKAKETAYNQLLNVMFDKVGGNGAPQLDQLTGSGHKSLLERATETLQKSREEVSADNEKEARRQADLAREEAETRKAAQARSEKIFADNGVKKPQVPDNQKIRSSQGIESGQPAQSPVSSDNRPPTQVPLPTIALGMAYQMKESKMSGEYRVDLNKYTEKPSNSMPFVFNVGNIKSLCKDCFLQINLDDAFLKQREINATLGGINSEDFQYINFVNVIIRKTHQDNQTTIEEIKIDKSQFNLTGNFFKAVYGWKGDNDQEKWLNYDYRTYWSFHDGISIETPWQSSRFGSISLAPPIIKKNIEIEIEPEFITENNIRSIEIKFFTDLKGKLWTKSILMTPQRNEFSKVIQLLTTYENKDNFEYEIIYFIRGKEPKRTERLSANYGKVYVDSYMDHR